jgi:spore germination protein GerM
MLTALLALPAAALRQAADTMTIQVFFHNEKFNPNQQDCTKVYPTTRRIPKTNAVATAALFQLFKGTNADERERQFVSFPPEDTKGILKKVNVRNGSAYVNFTDAVYRQLGTATTSCGSGFFSAVEKTLTQFPTIKKVFYAIEGNPRDFYEWVQVGECPRELRSCSGRNFR